MNPDTTVIVALGSIAVAILAHTIVFLFKTPKEYHGDLMVRVSAIDTAQQALALRFEGSYARHDEAIDHLTDAMKGLTQEIKALQQQLAGKYQSDRRRGA